MAESVQTGGLMQFNYRANQPKLKEEQKREIREAYEQHYEKKENDRKKKRALLIILLILLLALTGIGIWYYLS